MVYVLFKFDLEIPEKIINQCLSEFARQIERDPLEIGVAQQLEEIMTEQLENHTNVLLVNKVMLHFHNSIVFVRVHLHHAIQLF